MTRVVSKDRATTYFYCRLLKQLQIYLFCDLPTLEHGRRLRLCVSIHTHGNIKRKNSFDALALDTHKDGYEYGINADTTNQIIERLMTKFAMVKLVKVLLITAAE